MCKLWPGLRCTDHPQKKIVKLSSAIHTKEDEVSEVDGLLRGIVAENGEEGILENEEYNALTARKEKLLTEIQVLQDKREQEITSYATTAGGRAKLREMAADESLSPQDRANAQAELVAAESRIAEQKELGKVLNNPDLTDEEKELYAQRELMASESSLAQIRRDHKKAKFKIENLKQQIALAEEDGDEERLARLKRELAIAVTESTILEKHVAQKAIKLEELRKYMEKKYTNRVKQFGRVLEGVVDFMFQQGRFRKGFSGGPSRAMKRGDPYRAEKLKEPKGNPKDPEYTKRLLDDNPFNDKL